MIATSRAHTVTYFFALVMSHYGGMCASIGLSFWLTRLLDPSDLGRVVMCLFAFNIFNWITEWGWDHGLMTCPQESFDRAASTHLMIRITLALLPLVTFAVAKLTFFNVYLVNRELLILILVVGYFFEKVGLTYKTILERTYRLKQLAFFEFFSVVISYSIALLCALYGWGYISLAVQRAAERLVLCFGYFYASPWKFGYIFDKTIARTFFRKFGIATWVGGFCGIVIYDYMANMVGWYAGVYQAGLYEKAFRFATFPLMLTAIFQRLSVPLYVQYQNDLHNLKKIFIKAQAIKMFFLLPGQLLLALTASWWVPRFCGVQWVQLISVYQVLAVYGFVRAFYDDVPPLMIFGFLRPWELTMSNALQAVLILACGPILATWYGAFGGAFVMSLVMIIVAVRFWRRVLAALQMSRRDAIFQTLALGVRARHMIKRQFMRMRSS